MDRIVIEPLRFSRRARALAALACAALLPLPAHAAEPAPFAARAGLDIAWEAARAWAVDAELVYVENDEPVSADGGAGRWGYLFRTPTGGVLRGYSVRGGRIAEAADLGFVFEAPPLPGQWIDSQAALAAADRAAGRDYCRKHGGRLASMLLIRGAFNERHPDGTTWTVVYTADGQPSLMVIVDAARGEVLRTLKG